MTTWPRNPGKRGLQWVAVAASVWLAAPRPASAGQEVVQLTTYLRAGPGPQFTALDEIDPGDRVDVQGCDGAWCRVLSNGAPGFIRAEVLTAPDTHAKPAAPPPGALCFSATLNGRPRGGEAVRVCDGK